MKKLLVLILSYGLFLSHQVCAQTSVKVNPYLRHQQIKGWGASLCWWANMAGGFSEAKVDEICRWITSPEELNMNVFRYNIGGEIILPTITCAEMEEQYLASRHRPVLPTIGTKMPTNAGYC